MSTASHQFTVETKIPRTGTKRSAPKVRTGCQTCRQRKVKCDEARPSCRRCIKSCRECRYDRQFIVLVGGGQNERQQRATGSIRLRSTRNPRTEHPTSLVPTYGTTEESRYLRVYSSVAAPWFGRFHHQSFFAGLLPQSSWHHPAIKHALVSVAMASEEYHGVQNSSIQPFRRRWHYNQALGHLCNDSTANSHIILITCALFWLHDNVVNDAHAALVHLNGFLKIIMDHKRKAIAENKSYELEQTILRSMFLWSNTNEAAFANSPDASVIAELRSKLADPLYTHAFHDLRDGTADAFLIAYSLGWAIDENSAMSDQDPAMSITYLELQSFVEKWYGAYSTHPDLTTTNHTLLTCWYMCFSVVIHAESHDTELLDMYHNGILETLLTKVETLDLPAAQLTHFFENELVMPVIPVVTEAIRLTPDPQTRARAFRILRNLKRFETFWNSDLVATFLSSINFDERYAPKRLTANKLSKSMEILKA